MLPAATLLILIGVPGSGKSSLARFLMARWPHCAIVSTDAIRAKFYGAAEIQGRWPQIEAAIDRAWARSARGVAATPAPNFPGTPISSAPMSSAPMSSAPMFSAPNAIYDATNADPGHRRQAIERARRSGFAEILGLWVDVPLSLARSRNQARSRRVPDAAIESMYRLLESEPPTPHDGFDRVWRIANDDLRTTDRRDHLRLTDTDGENPPFRSPDSLDFVARVRSVEDATEDYDGRVPEPHE